MKIFIIFALIAVTFAANAADKKEQDDLIQEHIKKCKIDFPVTDEKIAQLKDGKLIDASEKERCFVDCFMNESGLMKNGKLDEETAIKKISVRAGEKDAKEAVKNCLNKSGPAKCEPAMKTLNCILGRGVFVF